MGDRYVLDVKCKCGYIDEDVWYAPTCGALFWKCPKCKEVIDLEEYSGIDAEGCANTEHGIKLIRELKKKFAEQKEQKGK